MTESLGPSALETGTTALWRPHQTSRPPFLLKYRSAKGFILTTVSIAVFTDIFLYGIIVPVTPFSLPQRVGIPQAQVQGWVSVLLAVYGAGVLIGSPISGWCADHSGSRRLPLLVGLLALAGSTIMLCVGTSMAVLIIGRFLQGLSSAIVWTVGLALLVDTVGQKDIGLAMGYVAMSMSAAILLGPLLGGVVYAKAGYYAVFAMAFGIIALDIMLRMVLIEKKIARKWDVKVMDEASLHIPSTAISVSKPDVLMTEPTAGDPGGNPEAQGTMTETTTIRQRRRRNTRVPPVITMLKSKRLLAALWGSLVSAALLTSFDSVLPLFTQRIFGWSSTGAGLIFLALVIPSFTAPLVGALSDRYGPRYLTTVGFLLALPFFTLLRLITHDTFGQKVLLCFLLFCMGFALTLVMTPLVAEITYVVEAKEKRQPGIFGASGAYAQAYGLFNMAFAAGTLVGPIWSGFVERRAGWAVMAWTLGLLAGVTALPTLLFTGGLITRRNASSANDRSVGITNLSSCDEEQAAQERRIEAPLSPPPLPPEETHLQH